jgi:hypothetical protein
MGTCEQKEVRKLWNGSAHWQSRWICYETLVFRGKQPIMWEVMMTFVFRFGLLAMMYADNAHSSH